MNIFKNIFKQSAPESIQRNISPASLPNVPDASKIKTYKVAGITHYEKSILKFAQANAAYSMSAKDLLAAKLCNKNIYQFNFPQLQTELFPEPDNPQDPNAIKVIVGGVHVGYIKAGSCKHVLKLIAENRIEKIDCEIGGGKFIKIWGDGKEIQQIEKGTNKYYVHLSISEK